MAERYRQHCTDDDGKVKPRGEIQRGIAMRLTSWQPGISEAEAMKRADHYMRAMPEWAGKWSNCAASTPTTAGVETTVA